MVGVERNRDNLTSAERKLVTELEEGGEVYKDIEFWEEVTRNAKRKTTDTSKTEPEEDLNGRGLW